MTLRTFWRIVLDFHEIQKTEGTTVTVETVPRLFADMTLWDISTSVRLGRLVENLTYVKETAGGGVDFENGYASFTGGFIRGTFHRESMEQQLVTELQAGDLESVDFSDISNPVGDENISITAHVRLPKDAGPEERPIFYMNQPTTRGKRVEEAPGLDAVCLLEMIRNGDERQVVWAISGDNHEASRIFKINDAPDIDPPRGFHRIRVHEDTGISSTPYVYEILADSIPLDAPLPANPASHQFHSDPVEFFIGGMPDSAGGMTGLHGQISYLEFDPNNSCNNCWA